jgi:hypothetical protein
MSWHQTFERLGSGSAEQQFLGKMTGFAPRMTPFSSVFRFAMLLTLDLATAYDDCRMAD